jgi:3-oxoacyl-[acyl-carrier protein] reductase
MDLHISGRTALVCSSTAGLGLAVARALAGEGARVAVTGRDAERAARAAAELGAGAFGLAADAADPAAADALADAVLERAGGADILVLNGPGPAPSRAAELGPEAVHEAVALLTGYQVRLVQRLLPGMLERGWGRIVAVGSSGVVAPIPNLAASNLGRAALAGYLKTLAAEVAASGVTVNLVLPGRIATDRVAALDQAAARRTGSTVEQVEARSRAAIPAARYGTAEEFGAVVAFLSSMQASYVTGCALRCDGGMVPVL